MDGNENGNQNGNVIFNPNQPPGEQNPQGGDVPAGQYPPPDLQYPPQDLQYPPADQQYPQADPNAVPQDEGAVQEAVSSPPGFFNRSLIKKGAIALGIIIFLLIIFNLLRPKNTKPVPVTLTWWGLWEDSQAMQPAIADFERQYPYITVNYVKEDPNGYFDRLVAHIQNGTGPDIYRFNNSWYPMLATDNALMPLTTVAITPAEFTSEYYKVMQNDLMLNGAIYGIPIDADSLELFINTDIARGAPPPQTWQEFIEDARHWTVTDNSGNIKTAGAALGTADNVDHAPDIISLLMRQGGVDISQFPTQPTPESDALNFYMSFGPGNQSGPGATVVWDDALDNSLLAFEKGNLAMFFGYSWDVLNIQSYLQQNNAVLHYKIFPVPINQTTNGTIANYWVEGVSPKTANPQAAMLFMHFLAQKSTLEEIYASESKERSFGEPYPRVDMASLLSDNPLVYPFVSQLTNATSSYFVSETDDGPNGINDQVNAYLTKFIDDILNNNDSIQTELPTLDNGIAQVYQKYGVQ